MYRELRCVVCLGIALALPSCSTTSSKTSQSTAAPKVAPKRVPVKKWADEICGDLRTYADGAPNPDNLEPSIASAQGMSAARFKAESFFRDYAQRADQLTFDLEASDIPNVQGGVEGRKVFNGYFSRAANALSSVQSRINETSTNDPATFYTRVQAIINESATAFTTNDLEKFGAVNQEMFNAFWNNPVCVGLPYGVLP